jgi:glutaredoxin
MLVLYVLSGCPYCEKAMKMLNENKIKFEKIIVPNEDNVKKTYKEKMGMNTFPMIFLKIDEDKNVYSKIGGSSDLELYIQKCKELSINNLAMDNLYKLYKLMYNK